MKSKLTIRASLLLLSSFHFVESASAHRFKQEWEPMASAESYEYEISEGPKFLPEHLVRQGTVKQPHFDTDFGPGIYYFRVRLVESDGTTGKWANPVRTVIKGEPSLIKLPKKNEKIEVVGAATPISFEWTSVEGATDYELRLQSKDGKILTYATPSPALSVKEIPTGTWEARVTSRINGEAFSKSEPVPFSITLRFLPRPRILEPLEGTALTAYEMARVRWTRSVPGDHSEVIVTRIDETRARQISKDPVEEKNETLTPALPPGRYQITVRDYAEDTSDYTEETVTVVMEADPMGFHAAYLGATFRMFNSEILWGLSQMQNPELQNGGWTTGSRPWTSPLAGIVGGTLIEPRLQTRIWSPWGLEISMGIDLRWYQIPLPTATEPIEFTSPFYRSWPIRGKIGPTYRWEPLGPTKPIFLKALIFGRAFDSLVLSREQVVSPNGSSIAPKWSVRPYYAQIYGLTTAAEWRYGGWNRNWDAIGECTLDWPLLAFGSGYGGGMPVPIPIISMNALLRRKFTDEIRFFGGFVSRLEYISSSRSGAPDSEIRSKTKLISGGVKGGIDIDL